MVEAGKFQQYTTSPIPFLEDMAIEVDGAIVRSAVVLDPWQRDDDLACAPAWLACVGQKVDRPVKRFIWLGRPRGHDKSSRAARLATWAVFCATRLVRGYFLAGSRDQARLVHQVVADDCRNNAVLASVLEVQKDRIINVCEKLPGCGSTIEIMSSDTGTSYGLRPDFIIADEISHWPEAGKSLWESLFSSAGKRPNCVVMVCTNAGWEIAGDWRWELREAARQSKDWVFSELPGPCASWISAADLDKQRAILAPTTYRRLWLNQWVDQVESPLLDRQTIVACQSQKSLWPTWPDALPKGIKAPELYVGIDIGRTNDRTVIWTFENVAGVAVTRDVCVLHNTPFADQKREIIRRIKSPHVRKVLIDKGGIGYQISEELEREFRGRVEGVALSEGRQGRIATTVKTRFQQQRVAIPPDPEIVSDFLLVEETETVGGLPKIRTNRGPSGHADRFWAMGLALDAMPVIEIKRGPSRPPMGYRSRIGGTPMPRGQARYLAGNLNPKDFDLN